MDFQAEFEGFRSRVERGIDAHVPPAGTRPARLHRAMRYSLEAGGKRLRPVLVLAVAEVFGMRDDRPLPAAVAIECLHTYSLIHDDLPCMDNDDLRRGRPTAHKAFDEATALLAGDALLTHAFGLLASAYDGQPEVAHRLVRELADAAGSRRLIGGQMEDLLAEKKADATAGELEFIHVNKTAAIIEASLAMGGIVAGAPETDLAIVRGAGRHLGLAFQITDDVLDATSDSITLGKTAGKDAKAGKTTYVKLHGLETSRAIAGEHTRHASDAFARLPGGAAFLRALAAAIVTRTS